MRKLLNVRINTGAWSLAYTREYESREDDVLSLVRQDITWKPEWQNALEMLHSLGMEFNTPPLVLITTQDEHFSETSWNYVQTTYRMYGASDFIMAWPMRSITEWEKEPTKSDLCITAGVLPRSRPAWRVFDTTTEGLTQLSQVKSFRDALTTNREPVTVAPRLLGWVDRPEDPQIRAMTQTELLDYYSTPFSK